MMSYRWSDPGNPRLVAPDRILSLIVCFVSISGSCSQETPTPEAPIFNSFISLTFYPLPLTLYDGTEAEGNINVTVGNHSYHGQGFMRLHACCVDNQISRISDGSQQFDISVDQSSWTIFNISVAASRLGRTKIKFYVTRNTTEYHPTESSVNWNTGDVIVDKRRKADDTDVGVIGDVTTEIILITSKTNLSNSGQVSTRRKATRKSNEKSNKKRRKQQKNNNHVSNNSVEYTVVGSGVLGESSEFATTTADSPSPRTNRRQKDEIRFSERIRGNVIVNNATSNGSDEITRWWLLGEYEIVVVRPENRLEKWLDYAVMVLIAINMVGIGGQIDDLEMLYLIKKPVAVSIGLFCRFGVMPALGLGLVELMKPSHQVSLSVLSFLCAPHEGVSCLLVSLAEKDVTLSFTLITIINFTAVALMPLWTIVFETRIYNDPGRAEIPFSQMFIVFGYTLASVSLGFYLEKKWTKLYKKIWMYMPVFTSFTVLFVISVEIYKSDFIFELITAKVFFLSAMLAAAGYIFGGAVAFLARQPISTIYVIAIETGCRTTYTTVLLLNMSLEKPESDIARTTPVLGGLLTLLPGFVAVLIHRVNIVRKGQLYAETECTSADVKDQEISDNDAEDISDTDSLTEIKETSM